MKWFLINKFRLFDRSDNIHPHVSPNDPARTELGNWSFIYVIYIVIICVIDLSFGK